MEAKTQVSNTIDADRVVGPVVQAGAIGTVNLGGAPAGTAVALVLPVRSDSAANAEVFVGRGEEAGRLSSLLRPGPGPGPGPGPLVSYVAGMGGVGKTALALHCARAAIDAKWFPGGVFSVDLQGYRADGGVSAESVLRPLMRLLGVDPLRIPADLGERAAAYQQELDQLGQSGRAVLLVFDNVSAADQVRGLLPAHSGHRVVITTRDTLDLPNSAGFSLHPMTADNATALLDDALRDLASGDRRISDDRIGTRELVRTCGRLPLALRIVAALLADEPALTPARLAAELTEAGIVGFVHGERALAAVLDLSWHRLIRRNRAAARLLRLPCLTVGPDCSTEVASVLNHSSDGCALPLLRMLRQAHLLALTDERWQMHDLVRAHTETHDAGLTPSDIQAADSRLNDHYALTTQDAVQHMDALPGKLVHNRFTRYEDALSWLDTEYSTLLAVAHKTAESGSHRHATTLCSQLALYQERNGHLTDAVMTSHLGYTSACRFGGLLEQATMANNLGIALVKVGLAAKAIDLFETAKGLYAKLDDPCGVAKSWTNLGNALSAVGRHEEAVRANRAAVDGYRQASDIRKEAGAWINVGSTLAAAGQLEAAVHAFEKAVAICQEISDPENEVTARTSMVGVLLRAGKFEDAVKESRTAITISQANRNINAEAESWSSLGFIYLRLGRHDEADDAYRRSIALESQVNLTGKVALRWTHLGHARSAAGNLAEAAVAHREAVRVYHRTGDRHGEAMTSNNLGQVLMELGDVQGAADSHHIALNLTRALDDPFGQAMTLTYIGVLHHRTGDIATAVATLCDVPAMFHRIGDVKREADAWLHLGMCLHDHDRVEAAAAYRKALSVATDSNNKEGMRSATDWLVRVSVSDNIGS